MSTPPSSFVTGATGFVGAWLAKALVDRGHRVTVLQRDHTVPSLFSVLELESATNVVQGDVCDAAVVERALSDYEVDTIFHLAAQSQVGTAHRSPVSTFETNIQGTWTVLESARRCGVPCTVVASSDKAYGDQETLPYVEDAPLRPRYPYDVSKAAADLLARSYWNTYELPVAVARFANIYGGGDLNRARLIPEAVLAALAGRRPVIRSDGTPERDYLYIDDAVSAYLALADHLRAGEIGGEAFNAGGGRSWSVSEIVALVCKVTGTDVEPDIRGVGTPHGEIDRQYVDTTKIEQRCGWKPSVTLEEGMERTVSWYRDHASLFGS